MVWGVYMKAPPVVRHPAGRLRAWLALGRSWPRPRPALACADQAILTVVQSCSGVSLWLCDWRALLEHRVSSAAT